MTGVSGMGYRPSFVTKIGDGTWHVEMNLQLLETLGGTVIKQMIVHYSLVLSRVNTTIDTNPWGLVITGFYQKTYRIKTVV